MPCRVSWGDHKSTLNYRGPENDRPAGNGMLLGFATDADNQPCGVVVVQGRELKTVRIAELRYEGEATR